MTRRQATFRQRDLTRAIRAAAASGVPVARVSVDKSGCINVHLGEATQNAAEPNPLDQWMVARANKA
jgi:hypothetical protein